MTHILFVDDEPRVLDGLKRMLRSMRHEWVMTFVNSGEEALSTLAQSPFDVVVSDMRMPGMDGAQLLNEVQRRYPRCVRIVLSGQSDQEMIYQSIGATHQFLSKPCEAEELKATIQRACVLRALLASESLRSLVAGIQTIPSLPTLYMEIKQEAQSDTSSLKSIGAIIAKDMGMTAKILQLVNSAFFGAPRTLSNPEEAVSLLGLERVQALILTVHVFSQFTTAAGGSGFQVDRLWGESMGIGALARAIAVDEKLPPHKVEQAYTAGLLHDVGMLVLASNMTQRYNAILESVAKEGRPLPEVEQRELGVTHAEVGAYLLGLWGLGDPIVEAVAFHHHPSECMGEIFSPLTAVHVASALHQESSHPSTEDVPSQIDAVYLEKLHMTSRLSHWRELVTVHEKEKSNV
jgi:HD-like signal output (HDOD) protein